MRVRAQLANTYRATNFQVEPICSYTVVGDSGILVIISRSIDSSPHKEDMSLGTNEISTTTVLRVLLL